jgi:L-xylulokinase
MERYAIGVDNGGTVIKAALFDMRGTELAVSSRQTKMLTPKSGYTERDMEEVWLANCGCIRDVVESSDVDIRSIIGVAIGGHGKGLYPWGKNDRPAYHGIVSTDNRAWRYPERWQLDGTADRLYPQICQKLISCQQASLLAWMKDNEKAAYDNIRWVFSVKDYIRYRLTGEAYCEVTDISGSGLMDVSKTRFDRELLGTLGIEEVYECLAPIRYSSDPCGVITNEASRLTGLPVGTPVAGGMVDIDACAVAMNMQSPDQLCTITGTWSINEFISTKPVLGTAIAMNSLYAVPGYYLLEECSATSAGNLEWFIERFLCEERTNQVNLYRWIDQTVDALSPADSEIYYLPFLYGSNRHPLAKGSFLGLTSYHGKSHMLRAVFEGVAFSHKTHIDRLLSVRPAPAAIRMAGGAANSTVWVQMFADVLGFPIETVAGVKELGALGCAMAAAVAAGVYPDYKAAGAAMVSVNAPVAPNETRVGIYREKYRKYEALCRALDSVWGEFAV